MRRSIILLLPVTLILASCDQKALDFARKARAMLDQYAAGIDQQIQTESQYYQRNAVLEVKHQHENLVNRTQADRWERGTELAASLDDGSKKAPHIRSYLLEYAQSEFNNRRDAYTGEADATRQYLANLQALQADKDRIQALSKLLDGLSQKLGLAAEAGAIKQAVGDTKTDFDKLICDDIAAKLSTATGDDKKSLTALQTTRHCPTGGGN